MSVVKVEGRSKEQAIKLLAAADKLGLDKSVVRTTTGGYFVPEEVAEEAAKPDAPEKKAPVKPTTKKATAKAKAADKE